MTPFEQEKLHQALLDLEQTRQLEERSRKNAESLLEGLQMLSHARSESDSVQTVLAVVFSVMEVDAVVILTENGSGLVDTLAESDLHLSVRDGDIPAPMARARKGKPVVLADAQGTGWDGALKNRHYRAYHSAMLIPVHPVERPCIIVCLRRDKAAFSKADAARLHYLVPLAAHAIRHSFKLAELRQAVIDLEQARKQAEGRARTDPLTGLANRMRLEEFITREVAVRSEWCFVLVDMNGFKPINDNFGHHAGDFVLVETGRRLQRLFPREALVARIGGDEFGLLVRAPDGRESAMDIGTMVCSAFAKPVEFGDHKFRVGASTGIAMLSDFPDDFEEVMTAADFAMFSIKARKETNFAIYDRRKASKGRLRLSRPMMLDAIETREMVPHFQPQVNLVTGVLAGLEVLTRWPHPVHGLIAPAEFLPQVERTGLTENFTLGLIRQVMDIARDWAREGLRIPRLAFNLTEATLAAEQGVDHLLALLDSFDDMGDRIVLEMTENVAFSRGSDQIKKSIRRLAAAGYKISLDDFGTGYASLSILDEIDFHELKIDRSFIAEIEKRRSAEVVIEAVIALAHGHDAQVVGEGVELRRHVDFLRLRSCDLGQGYLFGKPADASRTRDLIRAEQAGGALRGLTG